MPEHDSAGGPRRAFLQGALGVAAGAMLPAVGAAVPPTPAARDLTLLSLAEAARRVKARQVSPVELTQACLARIEAENPRLNAFITVTAESALAMARQAERDIQRGRWIGPLHGIPIGLKDLFDTAGVRTTGASGLFKDRVPTEDASVVKRLKAAGAVILGKLNLHEFAYGGSSVISFFGAVHNPWDLAVSAGGSSGGCAAAVAAGLCFGALGTDTGGSIREPAACCGIVGVKPTYGRVSTTGVIPLSWSLDHVGPMTRTVEDAALMLREIEGPDADNGAFLGIHRPDYAGELSRPISSVRVGVLRDYFFEGLHPEIAGAVEQALAIIKSLTRVTLEVPPLFGDASYTSIMQPYVTLLTAEAYAYHRDTVMRTPDAYQAPTLQRIRAGAQVAASDYILAQRELRRIRASVTLPGVDVLATPTVPVPPFPIAALRADPDARGRELVMLRNTRPFDFLGLPAVTVPCGFTTTGLPVGLQLVAQANDELMLLRVAHACERASATSARRPMIASSG
jgi:aspartyl-tRNA(Asn)/glutamyl-tRNA(Gln) amidotransferase subunit A